MDQSIVVVQVQPHLYLYYNDGMACFLFFWHSLQLYAVHKETPTGTVAVQEIGQRTAQVVLVNRFHTLVHTSIPLDRSTVSPPTGNLLGEAVPMPLHRNTCSASSRVHIAVAVIGHDKISCTFITDSPCPVCGTPLPFSQLHAHTHTH